jgi:hypothetical protein
MNNVPITQERLDEIHKFLLDGKEPLLPRSSKYKFLKRYSDSSWKATTACTTGEGTTNP